MAQLLVRDIMRLGVPTCRLEDTVDVVAAKMLDQNTTALVVLDTEADSRGWISEQHLAAAYARSAQAAEGAPRLTAADIMAEQIPECPADVPVTAALGLMMDQEADHLFFLHHAGGKAWPASMLSLRDFVRALAGPPYWQGQGAGAPRPTPMDLFRQRYGKPKEE